MQVYQQLRQASGYYNIFNVRQALVMQLLPKAEKALRENPNDKKLCTVMKDFDKKKDPESIAKQIAFIDFGEKYCNLYYHKKSSWGIAEKKETTKSIEGKYENLSYSQYYKEYVLPLVPAAMKKYKDQRKNLLLCDRRGVLPHKRDPKRDALRVAYRGEGKKYCPELTTFQQKDYMKTSYVCIVVNKFFCPEPNRCDAFERCKPNNGILFKDQ